jgi:hypothetical protein
MYFLKNIASEISYAPVPYIWSIQNSLYKKISSMFIHPRKDKKCGKRKISPIFIHPRKVEGCKEGENIPYCFHQGRMMDVGRGKILPMFFIKEGWVMWEGGKYYPFFIREGWGM